MDWDNLRYFLEVARAGRLTSAARRLNVDHTTVSRRLQALEKSMGMQLFVREPGGPWLTEGASSNVWIVQEGALLGPPPGPNVLPGIRVGLLRELCEEAGIAFNLRPICEADLRAADEVLLSSTGKEVLAVTRLDGEPVGHGALRGKPGPVYGRLYEAYQRAKAEQAA
mgnify:CR=1 FL=1